ncbi:hypothetical protein GDO78_004920 [Eleutherodactylus coqui]|uniref:TGF-beta family profile domain-containing protein n=1 Tax=Eleutherodactylus coqui TaxID=57060 RepID=A0A8J6KDV1_ELECQ|nr:hypothetical protein GDO78_004920 [Eleutherodactylus coqui]
MSWVTAIVHFTIFSMVLGMPSSLPGKQMRLPFQHSNPSPKATSSLHGSTDSHSRKHPPFMLKLYQILTLGNTTDLSSLEQSVVQDSDTILSLAAKSCSTSTNLWELSFDMSSITSNIEIQLAELRMQFSSPERTLDATLNIYHSKEGEGKIFLGSVIVDFSSERGSTLKVMNITRIMQSYFHQRESSNNKEGMGDKSTSNSGEEHSCKEIFTDKAVLVVFANTPANLKGHPNLIQTVESSKYVMTPMPSIRKGRSVKNSIFRANFPIKPIEDGRPLCRRVDMMVDFEQYGWEEQVVYPKKFNAYRCEGACPIPLSEIFKPTNHAYIKSLIQYYNSDSEVCSSCVPVKMGPLSMLMYDEGKVVKRNHEDIIVEECGCH